MKHLLRLGIAVAVVLLGGCSGPGRLAGAQASAAFLPLPGESATSFENRCLAYVTDHASYAEAARCMNRADRMRLASERASPPAPPPVPVRAAPRVAAASPASPASAPTSLTPPRASPQAGPQASPISLAAARVPCGTSIADGSADGGRTVAITVSGMITLGCKARLDRVVAAARLQYPKAQLYFVLNSPGGALKTAVQMSRIVEADQLPVVVPPNAMCASACFLILAASRTKYVSATAHVGVHSAAEYRPGYETVGSKAVTTDFARMLAQLGVPSDIIGHLVETPPGSIYWLSPEQLMTMGVRLLPT